MAIRNSVRPMRSGIVGTLASEGPQRAGKAVLNYTFDADTQNHATPSRAVTFAADGSGTVQPGGAGVFAGLILGNERVLSSNNESWYSDGDAVEFLEMGEIFANIDNSDATPDNPSSAAAVGGKVYFEPATGKLFAAATGSMTEIKGAVITAVDAGDSPTRLVKIMLNGPQA